MPRGCATALFTLTQCREKTEESWLMAARARGAGRASAYRDPAMDPATTCDHACDVADVRGATWRGPAPRSLSNTCKLLERRCILSTRFDFTHRKTRPTPTVTDM